MSVMKETAVLTYIKQEKILNFVDFTKEKVFLN